MSDAIAGPVTQVERDRFGRPWIKPANGGKPVAYTRATTVAETLDDRYNLELWKMRQVAAGLATRPDLVALAAAKADDKKAMDRVCQDAMDASASGAAANMGTALHAIMEQINRGADPVVPESMQRDIEAYRQALAGWDVLHAERFLVLDEQRIAGTADMIMRERDTGRIVIGDLKTGKGAITYGQTAIAVQLAIYSRGVIYHVETGDREPLGEVDQEKAIVAHLPAGSGRCSLFEVDIAKGWEAAQTALWVRQWRKNRNLFAAYTVAIHQGYEEPEQPVEASTTEPPDYLAEVAAAPTVQELEAIWRAAALAGEASPEITAACAARKAELTAA